MGPLLRFSAIYHIRQFGAEPDPLLLNLWDAESRCFPPPGVFSYNSNPSNDFNINSLVTVTVVRSARYRHSNKNNAIIFCSFIIS